MTCIAVPVTMEPSPAATREATALELLPITPTTSAVEAATCLTPGGLVDRDTASGDDAVLWSDPGSRATVERACAERRGLTLIRLRVA